MTTALLPAVAHGQAQQGPDPKSERSVASTADQGDIIVTAQRYEQRLQDVPISVSAVTADQIAARGVTSLEEMQYSIPGLSSVRYSPGGTEYIQLRGVSNSSGSQTVGQYLDETPITTDSQGQGIDIRLLDMERVEVLRGPQATLYGEGSMGGTIRYITASPKLDAFSGAFEGEVASVTDGGTNYKANGMVNIPVINDVLGIRLVGGYERDGGWIDNRFTGRKDINSATIKTFRAKVGLRIDDNTSFSLLALHQESDQDYQNFGIDRHTTAVVPQYNHDNYEVYNGVLTHQFGGVTLTGSIGYIDKKQATQFDYTPFLLPVLAGAGVPNGFITQIPAPGIADITALTNELRLSSQTESRFNWSVGAYMRNSKVYNHAEANTAPGTLPFTLLTQDQHKRSNAWAVYGEGSYELLSNLTVLAGLRYYHDRQVFESTGTAFGTPSVDGGRATFHSLNPRFNIKFTPSRTSTFYVNVSKGFRSGGFNNTSSGAGLVVIPPTYKPDTIWTYEAGAKQQFFDRKLDLEAAVYYNDWKDVQSPFLVPGGLVTTNGGKVQGAGIDFSATLRPVKALTLNGTFGWNNLDFKSVTADKIKGDPVDFAVRQSWSGSVDYHVPLSDSIQGFVHADYQHVGKSQLTQRGFGQVVPFPSRDMVGLRAGVDLDRFEIAAFASNLFDERAPLTRPFGAFFENVETQPRVVGVNVKVRY